MLDDLDGEVVGRHVMRAINGHSQGWQEQGVNDHLPLAPRLNQARRRRHQRRPHNQRDCQQEMPGFSAGLWPQFSVYNFLVANFWPIYWIGYAMDRARAQVIYRHVFAIAHDRAGDILSLIQVMMDHGR